MAIKSIYRKEESRKQHWKMTLEFESGLQGEKSIKQYIIRTNAFYRLISTRLPMPAQFLKEIM